MLKLIFYPIIWMCIITVKISFYLMYFPFKFLYYFISLIFGILFSLLSNVFPSLKTSTNINPDKELIFIDSLENGWEFESYIANLLKKLGYSNVRVTSGSGDFGVDVLASKLGTRYAFQCKLYSNPVGNKAVQEVVSGKIYYKCDKAIVVTNNYFTSSAKELANATQVELWDRDKLYKLINSSNESIFNFNKPSKNKDELDLILEELNLIQLDEYLLDAIKFTLNEEYISTSKLQRKLKIGFNKAQKLINKMIDLDLISSTSNYQLNNTDKNGHRVLLSKDEFISKYKRA